MEQKTETLNSFIVKHLANLSSITKAWKVALPPIEKVAYRKFVDKGDPAKSGSRRLREDQFYIAANIVRALGLVFNTSSIVFTRLCIFPVFSKKAEISLIS